MSISKYSSALGPHYEVDQRVKTESRGFEKACKSLLFCGEVLLNRSQVIARDGPQCIVTGYSFNSESEDYVKPHCAHIVPICIHKKVCFCLM